MERTRNWQGWLALALAGAALLVALSGRFWPGPLTGAVAVAPAAPVAPQAPAAPQSPRAWAEDRFERGRGGPPAFMREELDREVQRGAFGPGRGGWDHGPGFGRHFGPIGLLFGMLKSLGQLIALGLLAWLLLRMFRQRSGPPAAPAAPAAPTTPAGHDPRVE